MAVEECYLKSKILKRFMFDAKVALCNSDGIHQHVRIYSLEVRWHKTWALWAAVTALVYKRRGFSFLGGTGTDLWSCHLNCTARSHNLPETIFSHTGINAVWNKCMCMSSIYRVSTCSSQCKVLSPGGGI